MIGCNAARARPWSLALGASVIAIGIATALPASAQCSPDPTPTNGTTNCAGTDEDGVAATGNNAHVVVAQDAIVKAGTRPAAIAASGSGVYITVNGTVDGGSKAGVGFIAGPPIMAPCDPYAGATVGTCTPGTTVTVNPSASGTLTVATGASVTGAQALLLTRDPANATGYLSVQLANAGTMTGNAGPAIVDQASGNAYLWISNTVSGSIGGIAGAVGQINNDGVITGDTGSAIATTSTTIRNTGRIVSSGTAATVGSTDTLSINNTAGATIGGGTTAISAGGALSLTNAGTIDGSVVSTAAAGQNSAIDTRDGTIDGDLLLGAGDDTLRAAFDPATGRISSITGAIDGGAGTDVVTISIAADGTLGAVALPTDFEQIGFDLSNNATITLSPAFSGSGGISFGGSGTVINAADLTTAGPAVTVVPTGYPLTFDNRATIVSTLDASKIAVGTPNTLINSGAITAIGGGGVQAGTIVNSGTITASGTAASLAAFSYPNTLTNSGTIRSTGGMGASIEGLVSYFTSTNTSTGLIAGATTGANVNFATLSNAGTISGGTNGVTLGGGTLVNVAGGVVNGGTNGVLGTGTVVNAGTIDGTVSLVGLFVDSGGTVNGAIRFSGSENQLVTDLTPATGRPVAGATGGVFASDGFDTIRYRVNADASAALALPDGFEALAYELDNKAALTLTGTTPITITIGLTGNGTVTLNGTVSTSNSIAIDANILTVAQLALGTAGPAQALTIINNGTINLSTALSYYSYPPAYAVNAGTADVVNTGTISVSNAPGSYYPSGAVSGGGSVTNSGTISVSGGGIAISGAATVTNNGIITDTPGSGGYDVQGFTTLVNTGTIRFDQATLQPGYYGASITNSGIIESRLGTAVTLGYGSTFVNESGGTLTGVIAADVSSGGKIVNRGAIVGDISSYAFSYGPAVYVADGGTLTGNVSFGAAGDAFIVMGNGGTGVSGIVDGGAGQDVFGHILTASDTVSLDGVANVVNFESAYVEAQGAGTVATVTAGAPFAGTLYVTGDGNVVNQADIAGGVASGRPFATPQGVLPGYDGTQLSFTNAGAIDGGVMGAFGTFANTATVANTAGFGAAIYAGGGSGLTTTIDNAGTISATGQYNAVGLYLATQGDGDAAFSVTNSGTLTGKVVDATTTGIGIEFAGGYYGVTTATFVNAATGTISGEGEYGLGLYGYNTALTLDNAGTISGGTATAYGGSPLGSAILLFGAQSSTIRNTGTITGAVRLDAGNDRIENSGTITGPVLLGDGNDEFVERASATLGGLVDGGAGIDSFIVDATGDGTLNAGQLTGFETLTQTGTGTVTYAGSFDVATIALNGGTLAVAAGTELATTGATTVTGGDAGVRIVNAGTIGGDVQFGAGNDDYVAFAGSGAGLVDGGAGTDLYQIVLAGDHAGLGPRRNFEQLAITGNGTVTLALDQNFQSVALVGTGLNATLGGFTIDRIDGSAAAEQVSVDGNVGAVSLAGGDDMLALGATTLAGRYDGGDGTDTLRLTATAPVTLTGSAVNFETVSLAGGALTVAGTLGTSGGTLAFGDGAQSLSVAAGGTVTGKIDLGAGDDSFSLARRGTLLGTVAGGAGADTATLDFASDFTLKSGTLTGFERLVSQGSGVLTLAGGALGFDTMVVAGDLTIEADASLTTRQVAFGPADNHLTIPGGFAGSVAGGAGTDSIDVSGGSAAAPVAFGTISDIEALRMGGGFASIAGNATLGALTLSGGRLVGLAGSTITAPTISVGVNATFGSAGTVNGNLAVNGTLSPGASPGTMTVNGNVALAGGSVSVFEITPSVSDKLIVNGAVSIAQGSTLQLVATQRVAPGGSLDLIVARDGITGSYTDILKSGSLFGVVVQDGDSISLLGEFLNDAAFTPQVQRSINYVNSVLIGGQASDALLAATPQLVAASGASNQAAFAQLTPEAYASAKQITVEQGLVLADAGRSSAFAPARDTPGGFTFASTLGNFRTLDSGAPGTSRAQTNSYGFVGGIGWGSSSWSIGGFVGYLNSRQTLATLGARTKVDGVVAGVHARWTDGASA